MTLRKCIFDNENYSERGSRIPGTTTEIIYKPWNLNFWGFYISTRMNARTFYVPLLKTALHRVIPNLAGTSIASTLPLAVEINWLI